MACQVLLTPKPLTLAILDHMITRLSAIKAPAPVAFACCQCGGGAAVSICAAGRLLVVVHRVMAAGEGIIGGVQLLVAVHVADSRAPGAAPHGLDREHVCAAGLAAVQADLH